MLINILNNVIIKIAWADGKLEIIVVKQAMWELCSEYDVYNACG